MRKTDGSGKTVCSVWLSARAVAKSWPKGFSMTTRAPSAQPDLPSCSTTAPKRLGGIAR